MNDWVVYGKTWEEFRLDKLNKPWLIVEVNGRERKGELLIGDVNEQGGQCDCCLLIHNEDIVVRYRQVIDIRTEM